MAKKKNQSGASDSESEAPIIVEGEIVSDDHSPDLAADMATDFAATDRDAKSGAPSKASSKTPWIISGLLLVFVAGLFAAPWAEDSLYRIAPGLMPAPGAGVAPDKVRANESRIAANESAISELGKRTDSNGVLRSDMAARIGSLEAAARNAPTGVAMASDLAPVEARISSLESRLEELAATAAPPVGTVEQAGSFDVSAVTPNDELSARLATLEARLAAALAEREGDTVSFGAPETALAASADGADLAVVTARLIQRLGSSQPFETEFLTISALVSGRFGGMPFNKASQYSTALGAIENGSRSGISTIETLQADFDALASEVYRAANTPLDAPWWLRLWTNLKSAVTIRPTGEVSGADAGAAIARAEVRLVERDVSAAITEIEQLPEAAQSVLASWLEAARARRDADAAAHRLLALLEQGADRSATSPITDRATGPAADRGN